MKKERKPFILPALGMIVVLLVAVFVFHRFSRADDKAVGLSLEEAKHIALNDAGEQSDQVTYTKASLDQDSGIPIYEIDFYTDNSNYEYNISAQTGNIRDKYITVLQKETSTGSRPKQQTGQSSNQDQGNPTEVIGVKKAQSIALAAATLKENQVTFTKTNLETEDGNLIYEIEFARDDQKYEYDVDAYTGIILSYDIDRTEKLPSRSTVIDRDTDDDDDRYEVDDDNDNDDDDHDDDDDNDDDDHDSDDFEDDD